MRSRKPRKSKMSFGPPKPKMSSLSTTKKAPKPPLLSTTSTAAKSKSASKTPKSSCKAGKDVSEEEGESAYIRYIQSEYLLLQAEKNAEKVKRKCEAEVEDAVEQFCDQRRQLYDLQVLRDKAEFLSKFAEAARIDVEALEALKTSLPATIRNLEELASALENAEDRLVLKGVEKSIKVDLDKVKKSLQRCRKWNNEDAKDVEVMAAAAAQLDKVVEDAVLAQKRFSQLNSELKSLSIKEESLQLSLKAGDPRDAFKVELPCKVEPPKLIDI